MPSHIGILWNEMVDRQAKHWCEMILILIWLS